MYICDLGLKYQTIKLLLRKHFLLLIIGLLIPESSGDGWLRLPQSPLIQNRILVWQIIYSSGSLVY